MFKTVSNHKIKTIKENYLFMNSLVILLTQSNLLSSLKILSKNPLFKTRSKKMIESLKNGYSFYYCLNKDNNFNLSSCLKLIKESVNKKVTLNILKTYNNELKLDIEFYNLIKNQIKYPCFLIISIIVIINILKIFILPELLKISDSNQNFNLLNFISIFLLILLFCSLRFYKISTYFNNYRLSKLYYKYYTLLSFSSNIQGIKSFENNKHFLDKLESGFNFNDSLTKLNIPIQDLELFKLSQNKAEIISNFKNLSKKHKNEFIAKIKFIFKLIEPIAICLIGFVILLIVYQIYKPIIFIQDNLII